MRHNLHFEQLETIGFDDWGTPPCSGTAARNALATNSPLDILSLGWEAAGPKKEFFPHPTKKLVHKGIPASHKNRPFYHKSSSATPRLWVCRHTGKFMCVCVCCTSKKLHTVPGPTNRNIGMGPRAPRHPRDWEKFCFWNKKKHLILGSVIPSSTL